MTDGDLTIVQVAEDTWGVQIGSSVVRIHGEEQCRGHHCPFHNPSVHHMREWQINIRMDRRALVERICEHGVGHPDPDSAAFLEQFEKSIGVHGCDGCCWKPEEDDDA